MFFEILYLSIAVIVGFLAAFWVLTQTYARDDRVMPVVAAGMAGFALGGVWPITVLVALFGLGAYGIRKALARYGVVVEEG